MGAVIDSSVLIGAEKGDCDLWGRLELRSGEEVAVAAVTASELLHGVHRAKPAQRAKREAFVENVLGTVTILPFDLRIARIHARLWADLAVRGTPVGERDLMIAATAVGHGHRVVTRDQRSFSRVPGVDVEIWSGSDAAKIAMRSQVQSEVGRHCRFTWQGKSYDGRIAAAGANTFVAQTGRGEMTVDYTGVSDLRWRSPK